MEGSRDPRFMLVGSILERKCVGGIGFLVFGFLFVLDRKGCIGSEVSHQVSWAWAKGCVWETMGCVRERGECGRACKARLESYV